MSAIGLGTVVWLGSPSIAFGQIADAPEEWDAFGTTLATGDFDGDGYPDLAIAAATEKLVGFEVSNGVVHVLHGGPDSLSDARSQIWHQDRPGIKDAVEPDSELFGSSLAVGDFDADGADDLVIGVPYESVTADEFYNAGSAHVLYGVVGLGLRADGDQLFSQDAPGIAGEVDESNDFFGDDLATGDFNGDGFADLALGALGDTVASGSVHVLYGSVDGLSARGSQRFDQDRGRVKEEIDFSEQFGASLAAGDFDGDGLDDLAIGAPYEDVDELLTGSQDAGVVHVLHGSVQGLTAARNELWVQPKIRNPAVTQDPGWGTHFGSTLASGDFDGNGVADLVIGDLWQDEGFVSNLGVLHVLFGSVGVGLTDAGNQYWHQGVKGILERPQEFEHFGHTLGVADFNGDGVDDLAVGVSDDTGGREGAGGVHVLSGLSGVGLTDLGDQYWSKLSEGIDGDPEAYGGFGGGLAGADFDGDGLDDLAIGCPGDTVNGTPKAGSVHILPGSAAGGVTATGAQLWSQDS